MLRLITFLQERITEDERAAQAAPGSQWGSFTASDPEGASVFDEHWALFYPEEYEADAGLRGRRSAVGPSYVNEAKEGLVRHVARWDPARVERECAAKRALIKAAIWSIRFDGDEGPFGDFEGIRALAKIYEGHPEYAAVERDGWNGVLADEVDEVRALVL